MAELVKYEEARRLLAEAVAVDEVQAIRSKAEAMRAYARQAKDRELELNAAELRIRAERRLGQMILAQKETIGLNRGGSRFKGKGIDGRPVTTRICDYRPTLAEVGIDRKLSSRAQRFAAINEAAFERQIEAWRCRQRSSRAVTINPDPPLSRKVKYATAVSGSDFVLSDARVLGTICFSDIEFLIRRRSAEIRLLERILNHVAQPDPTFLVADVISDAALAVMIAAEIEVAS